MNLRIALLLTILGVGGCIDRTPEVFVAAREGDVEKLKEFVTSGGNVNIRAKWQWTLLMESVKFRQIDAIEYLVGVGADPMLSDQMGFTVLDYLKADLDNASSREQRDEIETIFKILGHPIEVANPGSLKVGAMLSERKTPSRDSRDAEDVRKLIEKGLDANLADEMGVTLLMHAAAHGSLEVCKTLIESGANPELKSNEGKTARDYVCTKQDSPENAEAILELLTETSIVGEIPEENVVK